MESQAQALHRHSTARTDAALQELSQGIAGHLESSLAKKVDWDAMKTTLDSQIRSVFRIQLQGLMKEVEQRVLDTLQAHHRGDAEAEHSTELSLAPAMTDVADAIDRMDQTASMVATIDDKVDEGNSILRIIHYPPIAEESAGHVRAGAHEDINLITLLLGADEGGLQILRKDGKWLDVNPAPGCVTCNIGDMLQRLTNHVLPSTTHRVVNPPKERAHIPRFSMPYFLHPNPDYVIETLESCISNDRPNRYPEPISSDDYLQERLMEIKLK